MSFRYVIIHEGFDVQLTNDSEVAFESSNYANVMVVDTGLAAYIVDREIDEACETAGHGRWMDFGSALNCLEAGKKVARNGWNGVGLWLEMQTPDANSKMTLPYIYINYPANAKTTPGAKVPWLASQTDMLAKDWYVVE